MSPLTSSTPDASLLLFTGGVALIAVELNRPGLIVPGAAGLTAVLLAIAAFARQPLRPVSVTTAFICLAVFVLGFRKTLPLLASILAGFCLTLALSTVIRRSAPVQLHAWIALPCGLVLSFGLTVLARIALHARRNKGLD